MNIFCSCSKQRTYTGIVVVDYLEENKVGRADRPFKKNKYSVKQQFIRTFPDKNQFSKPEEEEEKLIYTCCQIELHLCPAPQNSRNISIGTYTMSSI